MKNCDRVAKDLLRVDRKRDACRSAMRQASAIWPACNSGSIALAAVLRPEAHHHADHVVTLLDRSTALPTITPPLIATTTRDLSSIGVRSRVSTDYSIRSIIPAFGWGPRPTRHAGATREGKGGALIGQAAMSSLRQRYCRVRSTALATSDRLLDLVGGCMAASVRRNPPRVHPAQIRQQGEGCGLPVLHALPDDAAMPSWSSSTSSVLASVLRKTKLAWPGSRATGSPSPERPARAS